MRYWRWVAPVERMSLFALPSPTPGTKLTEAIQVSMDYLKLAPERVTLPLYAAAFRPLLGAPPWSAYLYGKKGTGKTELAALVQQFYGPTMDCEHLPANWSSTPNALEGLLYLGKDMVVVIDDRRPPGSRAEAQRMNSDTDRVLRAQANRAGRIRSTPEGLPRPPRVPRGMCLSTGETLPEGESLLSRLLPLYLAPGDVRFELLSAAQTAAREGKYAQVTASYIRWLSWNYEGLVRQFKTQGWRALWAIWADWRPG